LQDDYFIRQLAKQQHKKFLISYKKVKIPSEKFLPDLKLKCNT